VTGAAAGDDADPAGRVAIRLTEVEAYRGVLEAFPGKKVVVRPLDAGADKPLPFLTDATEANPALGVRAYRTTRRDPEVLEHQLEALAGTGPRARRSRVHRRPALSRRP